MNWMLWVTIFSAKIAATIIISIGSVFITNSKWYIDFTTKISKRYLERWIKSNENEES